MRFTNEQREFTTDELLSTLSRHRDGLSTTGLATFPRFQNLTNRQIIRLLKNSGEATRRVRGRGMRTCHVWRLIEGKQVTDGKKAADQLLDAIRNERQKKEARA